MNLSLLERRLAGLESNDFEPSLEVEQGRCCVVLRPRAQREPGQDQPARSARSRPTGARTGVQQK